MIQRAACAFAAWWTSINRKPLAILVFVPLCLVFLTAGWMMHEVELFLLTLTTVLSIDASLSARMVMLQNAQQNGDEPA